MLKRYRAEAKPSVVYAAEQVARRRHPIPPPASSPISWTAIIISIDRGTHSLLQLGVGVSHADAPALPALPNPSSLGRRTSPVSRPPGAEDAQDSGQPASTRAKVTFETPNNRDESHSSRSRGNVQGATEATPRLEVEELRYSLQTPAVGQAGGLLKFVVPAETPPEAPGRKLHGSVSERRPRLNKVTIDVGETSGARPKQQRNGSGFQ
eukprot:Hpha_TRINITY_DN8983_c0_g1::TRINITY_DN8983_c0_g1_i1::g.80820::m.80820